MKKVLLVLLLFFAVGIVAAQIIPRWLRNRSASPESLVLGDLRSIVSGEVAYASANDGAFGRLECLAAPAKCGHPADSPIFLDPILASLQVKHGYKRSFIAGAPGKGKPDPGIKGYVIVATPERVRSGSSRGFAADESGLICVTPDGTAPPIVNGALAPNCTALP